MDPLGIIISSAIEPFTSAVKTILDTIEKFRPVAEEREKLANDAHRAAATLDKPWQTRQRSELLRAEKLYRAHADVLRRRTDEKEILTTITSFAVDMANLEETFRTECAQYAAMATTQASLPAPAAAVQTLRRKSAQHARRMMELCHVVPPQAWNYDLSKCATCGSSYEVIELESLQVCPKCGDSKEFVDTMRTDENTGAGTTRPRKEKNKRRQNIEKGLKLAQYRESRRIDVKIIRRIAQELLARDFIDPTTLTIEDVDRATRDLELTDCYDHIVQIFSRLTGTRPPQLSNLQNAKFIALFDLISPHYAECKGERINFIKYTWVCAQVLKLLSEVPTLPDAEREQYRKVMASFPSVKRDDTKTRNFIIFEQMLSKLGLDTTRPGLELRK